METKHEAAFPKKVLHKNIYLFTSEKNNYYLIIFKLYLNLKWIDVKWNFFIQVCLWKVHDPAVEHSAPAVEVETLGAFCLRSKANRLSCCGFVHRRPSWRSDRPRRLRQSGLIKHLLWKLLSLTVTFTDLEEFVGVIGLEVWLHATTVLHKSTTLDTLGIVQKL